MCGRVYRDNNFNEFLVIRDDFGEFVVLLDRRGNESVASVLKLKASTQGRNPKGKWTTKNLKETLAEYKDQYLPESWCKPIQQMQSKELEAMKLI